MTDTFRYAQLNGEEVDASFRRDGSVMIRLSERHATACAALIETCLAARRQQRERESLFRRANLLLRGWFVAARIGIFQPRLMELTSLLVLQDPACSKTREQNGEYVFHFAQR